MTTLRAALVPSPGAQGLYHQARRPAARFCISVSAGILIIVSAQTRGLGEALVEAPLKLSHVAPSSYHMLRSLSNPFWLLSSCQALDPPEPQLPTLSSASFSAPHAPTLHDSPLLYRRLALGQQTCRHFPDAARPAPTGQQPTTLLSAGVCSVLMGLALSTGFIGFRKRMLDKFYCTFRVFRGTYRRRKTPPQQQ